MRDLQSSSVFAWLTATNENAIDGFEATMNEVLAEPQRLSHHARHLFIYDSMALEGGPEPSDVSRETAHRPGKFRLCLGGTPLHPTVGWVIGNDLGASFQGKVGILLTPPTKPESDFGIVGRHGRLHFHGGSEWIILQAWHVLTLVKSEMKVLKDQHISVLEDNDMIKIGECICKFNYTDYSKPRDSMLSSRYI